MPHVLSLRCPSLPVVRIALIGLGNRGLKTLERYRYLHHAAISVLADLDGERLLAANAALREDGRPEARTFAGKDAWQKACAAEEVDLVYICTDWASHTQIAVGAMEQGKHVAVEVPAAMTVEECWRLVDTAERTQRHCFMTENCCYDSFSLATLQMARSGLFGDITHCEGAYIHHLFEEEESPWMIEFYKRHGGNPYPTHGLGPIAWQLGLHRGDRMDYLVSMTSKGTNISNTLIRTVRGRSILLQLDVKTPRPYSRMQTLCGTRGFAQKYPVPTLSLADGRHLQGDDALREARRHFTGDAAERWQRGHDLGVPNEMNYAMDSRLIHCLHNGLPLDIDVYDAAEWSCIAALSRESALNGSRPVAVPDFTRGHWQGEE
ncbi:MAG: Gfo/Idh/MocA family oxidoreductase [Alloprevotella sp.]|nr:Gfo/Idh/MocA family oxidoreductase [Alloprevotella sp.]